ncbi:MAG: BatD family protein [Acidobacteriota bacterium]
MRQEPDAGGRRSGMVRAGRLAAGLLICSLGLTGARAEEIAVSASVDRSRLRVGDSLTLTVEVVGAGSDRVAAPDVPRIDDFDLLGGPAVSRRFRWVNGRSSSSVSFRYTLAPRRPGRLRIPPVRLLVGGRTYATRTIEVEVLPPGAPPPSGPPSRGPRRRPAGPGPRRAPSGDEVRVRAEAEPRTVYVGQQVTVAIILESREDLLGLSLKDTPSFQGFWSEEIELPDDRGAKRIQIGGIPYVRYTLMKRALFPTSAGRLTIPSVTYQIQVRRRSRDPIESFFFTPVDNLVRSTAPIAIDVLPLPEQSRPADFSGAVGRFDLAVSADRSEAAVNDAVGLKVRVAGEGNLRAVGAPRLPDLTDFKKYDPKVSSTTGVREDRLHGEKTWDYVLIPLAPGEQTIPPVTFSFFDPEAERYRTVWSAPIPIRVARGEGTAGSTYAPVTQADVRRLRQDIHYIKLAPEGLRDRSRPFYRTPLFAALLLLPVAADLGIFAAAFRRDRWRANARARRERRARSVARRRLREARRRMSPASSRAFYAAVARALTEYVADKFDTSAAGLTHQRIEELLAAHGAEERVRLSYHRCLEACDYARFAPTSSGEAEMLRIATAAERTLVALERSLQA